MTAFTPISKASIPSLTTAIGDALLPPGTGITIDYSTLELISGASSVGFYDGSLAQLGIGAGLILTSGTMPGTANTAGYFGVSNNMPGDPMLDAVVNTVFQTVSLDATTLSVSFTVNDPSITSVSFNVVFGSDEFPEWVNQFVDIAAIWVNGVDYAYFNNDPNAPLSVIGSNLAANYFIDNTGNLTTSSFGGIARPGVPSLLPIEYDGVSAPLTVTAPVHQGVNTLKIGIADTRDHIYDSGIIISNMVGGNVPVTGITRDVDGTEDNDELQGTDTPETLHGRGGADDIHAGGGDDVVLAGDGDDYIMGGAGNDYIDGGAGIDTAVWTGASTDYTITANADGTYTVADQRVDPLDGTDTLVGVENVQFADVTLDLATMTAIAPVTAPIGTVPPGPPAPPPPAPVVLPITVAPVLATATEDGQIAEASAFLNVGVDDSGLTVTGLPATMPAGVSYNSAVHAFFLDPSDAAYQSLAAGEQMTVTVDYLITNSLGSAPASVVFTVTGTNDAPVVGGTVTAAAAEGGVPVTVDALLNASDVDHGATLTAVTIVAAPAPVSPAAGGHGADDAGAAASPPPVTLDPNGLPAGVTFDAAANTFTLDPKNAAYAYLSAGQTANVVVNYGVSDGTAVTPASADFVVTGTNSAPVVTGPATLNATEGTGGALLDHAALLAHASDADTGDTLRVEVDTSNLPAGVTYQHTPGSTTTVVVTVQSYYGVPVGTYTIDVPATDALTLDTSGAAYDALAQGETLDLVVPYGVSDGTETVQTTAVFHVTGTNDAPVVTGPATSTATEGGGIVTIDGLAAATDVDHGTTLSVVALPVASAEQESFVNAAGVAEKAPPPIQILPFDPATFPAGVTFDAATNSFSLDANAAIFSSLGEGQTQTVTVNYGVSDGIVITPASAVFTVTGINNTPVVSGPVTGLFVNEDGAKGSYDLPTLLSNTHDPDIGDKLTVSIDTARLPAGVSYVSTPEIFVPGHTTAAYVIPAGPRATGWGNYVYPAQDLPAVVVPDMTIPATTTLTIDPSDASFQHLGVGDEQEVVVNYTVSDGEFVVPAQAIFTVNGMNDAPVVAGATTGAATEGGPAVTVDALAEATDEDDGAVLNVVASPVPVAPVFDNPNDAAELIALAAAAPIPAQAFDATTLPAGVSFDAASNTFTLDPTDPAYNYLSLGQTATVSIDYGVSDGFTVTAAKTNFTVTGTNDAPVVSSPMTLGVTATGGPVAAPGPVATEVQHKSHEIEAALSSGTAPTQIPNAIYMLGNASDVDQNDTLSVTGLPASLPAGVLYVHTAPYYTPSTAYYGAPVLHPGLDMLAIDPSDAAFRSLAAGETTTVTVDYGVTDGIAMTAASAVFTVTGINDAPVVSGPVTAAATEDGALITVSGLGSATDVDHGSVLAVTSQTSAPAGSPVVPAGFAAGSLPAGVSFDAAANSFSFDPSNAAYQSLSAGQTKQVTVTYGVTDGFAVTPASVVFTVTGTNDLPVVTGTQSFAATAGGAAITLNPAANVTDVDALDVLKLVPGPLATGVHTVLIPGGYYQPDIQITRFLPSDPYFRHLAQGQTETVTWNYAVTDGMATVADSAAFTVTGVNDAPVILSQAGGAVLEDSDVRTVDVLANAIDYDDGAVLSVVNVPALLPAGVTYDAATHVFSLNPADASFQALGQGDTQAVSVSYGISDGIATTMGSIQWTVVGVNDAPVVTGPVLSTPNEGSGLVTINPLGNASDVDDHQGLHVKNLQAVLPAGLTFNAATDRFVFDSNNAAYDYLSAGESLNFTVNYSVTDGLIDVAASTIVSVQGKNDLPVVSGSVKGGTVLANAASPVTLALLGNAADVDHLDVLSVAAGKGGTVTASVTSGVWTAPVTFTVANNQLTLNPAQFASLAAGKSVGLTFNYQVTDGNAGVAVADSATVTIQGTNTGPTGATLSPATSSLGKLIAGSGLNPKQALANLAQLGGMAGDSYSYAVGGTGASSFAIGSSSGVAQLMTGNTGPVGAAGGQLYTLNITATDTTAGISAPAVPVDVVVGLGHGNNTINLASLPGMVTSTPAFVYDLGGADTVNAAGMTGQLWIDGGQGADVMTGGSGPNTYLYSATADSTPTAMDIVTNFHASVDMLDFTGLGTKFSAMVALASNATTIQGGAIGWQTTGGNTFVYVNTSGNSQNLTAAAMKVELQGTVPLTAANIAHL